MPTPGLSLVGFMTDPQQVFQHLRIQCIPDPADIALLADWNLAQTKRGPPMTAAGAPDIQPIPATEAAYTQQLMQQPWVQEAFRMFGYTAADFKLVEIDPLLAYHVSQKTGDAERA